ncbi:hypothetical protein NXW94_30590 [Bacteroides ovatus]|nr:hypothetical protein [Bacteroides ovatus]
MDKTKGTFEVSHQIISGNSTNVCIISGNRLMLLSNVFVNQYRKIVIHIHYKEYLKDGFTIMETIIIPTTTITTGFSNPYTEGVFGLV